MTTLPAILNGRVYLTGYNGTARTRDEFIAWHHMVGCEPELRRRTLAIVDASIIAGLPLGVGSITRGKLEADNGFKSRYKIVPNYVAGAVAFEGHYWVLRPGYAPMMPSDRTYHVRMTPKSNVDPDADGLFALAIDFIGNLSFLRANAAAYSLIEFSKINGEPWHAQGKEYPTARRSYVYGNKAYDPLPWARLPGFPEPAPTRVMAVKPTLMIRDPKSLVKNAVGGTRQLQLACNFWGWRDVMGRTLIVDDDFGMKTAQGVMSMQGSLNKGLAQAGLPLLRVDGEYGLKTSTAFQRHLDILTAANN